MARLKHHVIDGFLPDDLLSGLRTFALLHEADFVAAQVRATAGGAVDPHQRRSWRCTEPLGDLREGFLAEVETRLSELLEATGTPPFPRASDELELAAHRDGDFFAAHIDTYTAPDAANVTSDRLVSLVCYLHADTAGFSGGDLALYPFGERTPIRIEPRPNRLVAFPSFALHEVLPVHCPDDAFAAARLSLNCWLRRPRTQ